MAGNIVRNRCATCDKEKASFKCEGCSKSFCFNHVTDHRQQLNKEFDQIEVARDLFRQTMTENTKELQDDVFAKRINEWEENAIENIRRTANKARNSILKCVTDHRSKIELRLTQLTDLLRENRQKDDFVETDLNRWKDELTRLEELSKQSFNFSVQRTTIPLVTKIIVAMSVKNGTEVAVHDSNEENGDLLVEQPHEESPQLHVKQEHLVAHPSSTTHSPYKARGGTTRSLLGADEQPDFNHLHPQLRRMLPLTLKGEQVEDPRLVREAPTDRETSLKECPMCSWSFPSHMTPFDQQKHVEDHFS